MCIKGRINWKRSSNSAEGKRQLCSIKSSYVMFLKCLSSIFMCFLPRTLFLFISCVAYKHVALLGNSTPGGQER